MQSRYYYKYCKYKHKYISLKSLSGGNRQGGKQWKIIITLPHAVCLTLPSGTKFTDMRRVKKCDLASEKFGYMLYKKLKASNFNISTPIEAKVNRSVLDNNRFITIKKEDSKTVKMRNILSDSTMWDKLREEIRKYCETGSYKDIIVFDIHSFPKTSFPPPATEKDITMYDVVLLDNKKNEKYQDVATKLYNYLKKNYSNNVHITTSRYGFNAIIDVMRTHPLYIKTVLLEINETLSEDQYKSIAVTIKNFLENYST